jgi:hypothetical protein
MVIVLLRCGDRVQFCDVTIGKSGFVKVLDVYVCFT